MLAEPKDRTRVKNAILASLSWPDLAAIGKFFEPVVLKERMIVQELNKPVEHVYFIESGKVSIRIVAGGSMLETAMVGYRGAVGATFLVGGHIPTHQSIVRFPGQALRIRVDDLQRVMGDCPEVRERLSKFAQALMLHSAQSGFCAVRHHREQRVACWLCLTSNAIDNVVLPITHDYLSAILGLRRAGVTETLTRFEERGLIRKMRGVLQVDNLERLESEACSCYAIVTKAYAGCDESGRSKFARCLTRTTG